MKKKKYVIYAKKEFRDDDKNKKKVRDHCHYTGSYIVPKKIPIVFHNGSTYDYRFVIKKFKGDLECLGENTEKTITFSVPLKKKMMKKSHIN